MYLVRHFYIQGGYVDLYTAAFYTNGFAPTQKEFQKLNDWEKEIATTARSVGRNILDSYHYIGKKKYVDEIRADGGQVFLDSGAFSAHTLGVKMNIDDYCNYIITNNDILRKEDGVVMASVLDGIGDPQKTYENQMYMEYKGAKPLPCFHFGEDPRYLEWYVARYPYITIGGMVGRRVEDLIAWLDPMWNEYMLDASGNPRLKVHAFGITSPDIMRRYPWFSVDSSSWIQYAVYGHIYFETHGCISVSSKSPNRHKQGMHVENMWGPQQNAMIQDIQTRGFDFERLSTVYESRAFFNMHSFHRLNDMINAEKAVPGFQHDCTLVQGLF